MTRLRLTTAVLSLLALASCGAAAGPVPTSAPTPDARPGDEGEEGRPVDEPYIYEVAPEQVGGNVGADSLSILEVSGSAEVRVPADRARITFAVETEDNTARGASNENARRMESAMAALRGAGVEGLELETRGYQLQPRYSRPDDRGRSEIDGYRARNLIEVRIPDVSAVGRLIDAAVGAGANRIASLAFEASDTEEARIRALEDAVGKARRQAEAVAGAMGLALGRALHVQTGSSFPEPPVRFRAEAMAAQATDTPIEPGEQTVSANVTIRYTLEDR